MENKRRIIDIDGIKVIVIPWQSKDALFHPRCPHCACSYQAKGKLKNYCRDHSDIGTNTLAAKTCRARNGDLFILLEKEAFKKYKRNHGKFITDK